MDSEKDMEEFQGREVFVSQLLDWDSLTCQLIVPAEKASIFKAHYNHSLWHQNKIEKEETQHPVIILFEKGGYKALAKDWDSLFENQASPIYISYSYELANALKEKFKDLYEWLSDHKEDTGAVCPWKVRISLVASYSMDVYKLSYSIENDRSSQSLLPDIEDEDLLDNDDSEVSSVQHTPVTEQSTSNNDTINGFDSGTINNSYPLTRSGFDTKNVASNPIPSPQTELMSFTLVDEIPNLHQTKPIDFIYENQRHEVLSWTDLVVQIAKIVLSKPFGYLLKKASSRDYSFAKRQCIGKWNTGMLNPRQIAKDLWIETALDATQLANFAKWMVRWCILPQKAFCVHYKRKVVANNEAEKVEHSDETPKSLATMNTDMQFTLADLHPKAAHHFTPNAIAYQDKTYPVNNWEEFAKQMALIAFSSEYGYRLRKSANFEFAKQFRLDDSSEQLDIGKIDSVYDFSKAFALPSLIHFVKIIIEKCRINPRDIVIYYHINKKDSPSQTFHPINKHEPFIEKDIAETSKPDVSHDVPSVAHEQNRPLVVSAKNSSQDTGQEFENASFTLADDIPLLTFTRPLEFTFNGKTTIVRSWAKLMVQFITLVFETYGRQSRNRLGFDDFNLDGLPFISKLPLKMRIPKRIGDDLWIETNVNAQQLVGCLKRVASYCCLDLHDIVIHYERKSIPSSNKRLPISLASQQGATYHQAENSDPALEQSCRIIFSKRLNWSMMTLGMTIPVDTTQIFLANLSYQPHRGRMYPITLIWDGIEYSVKMEDVNYSDEIRYRTMQIRYTKTTPISIAFQTRFQSAYQQMQIDHKNTEGIDTFITLVTTNRLDCFELKVSTEQVDILQSDKQLPLNLEETKDNAETIDISVNEQENFDSDFIEECRQILENAFVRGFKNGSIIDKNKFSRKYEELFGKPMTNDNVGQVWDACAVVGIVVEDKVFPLTEAAKESVKRHAEELIQKGARQIYFSSLFDQFLDEFCENGIGSSDVLAAVLAKLYPEYMRTEQFLQIDSTISSEDEIVRVLREYGQLTLDGLQEKLPGMPEESILQACKACKDVMKDGDKYILLDNIQFDEEEIIQARNVIESSIEDHGYVMLREINLENSLVLNDDISFEALAKVAFSKYFADDFSLANSLVSRKGESLSVSKIVKAFCEDHTQFTLKEVEEFANQINGYDSAHSLGIAQDNAIQVDDEHFVHPSLVDFDVDEIDKAIENVMTDKMQPLLAFKTFFNFPAVPGYPWTLKLLASYCRHFSHEFTLLEHAPNNVSIGIIIHKNIHCNSYYQAVAMMALNDGIPMDSDSIGNYSIRKGFLNRKRPSALSSILSEMQQLSGEA